MSELEDFRGDDPPKAVAPAPGSYISGLNEVQRQAVEALDGPVLVLAGAGTGKTRVLTTRLAHILTTGRAAPSQVLAVTFTNKAAREMKERVEGLLGRSTETMWIGTFHSLAARILRRHAELLGLKSNFTILDSDDQVRLIKQLVTAAGIDDKRWPPRGLHTIIERWKDRGLTPEKVRAGDVSEYASGKSLELYRAYQDRLKTLNACDFGDLMLHCLTLFTAHEDVLADYQNRFRYLLVDEYQDTNVAQYLWLRLLARAHHNICCVGDDDQSIYGWRGAEVGNILRFEKDFPGAVVVRLEQNYRSTPHILATASGLIACNEGRLGKTLWTEASEGEKVAIRGVWDGAEEARVIGDEIETLHRKGHTLSQIAILVRTSFQMREFEERFITLGLPYRVIGGPRFYERREIRDAIAYFRVLVQPDDDLAFERIINVPKRGLGDATLRTIHHHARSGRISLTQAVGELLATDELTARARNPLFALMADFTRWRGQLDALPHDELAALILDESGYTAMWKADKAPDAPGRLENLKELIAALEEFVSLPGFLEHVSLVMENAENAQGDMVNLMTLHSAKGLEFDTVFLPGWEEGLFPHQRAMDEGGTSALEEERRLAYVGLTRARKRADISFAASRHVYNQWLSPIPSRFLDEVPEDHVERITAPGLYGGGGPRDGLAEDGDGLDYAPEARRYGGGGPRIIEGTARRVKVSADPPASKSGIRAGDEVFHQKFGYGRVNTVDGDKLEIAFSTGVKKVMESFVEPA